MKRHTFKYKNIEEVNEAEQWIKDTFNAKTVLVVNCTLSVFTEKDITMSILTAIVHYTKPYEWSLNQGEAE